VPPDGGFDVCCGKPEAHVPMDLEAWHLAQERLERQWLDEFVREHRTAPVQNPVLKPRRP
jgi:hypothetical protein